MKDTKAVFVTTYEVNGKLNSEYAFPNQNKTIYNDNSDASNERTREFGCQYDMNTVCTCRRIKRKEIKYYSSRQVYRSQKYLSARGFTDIGVGDVKTLPRKRVKRIYLPDTIDTGAGSSELTSIIRKTEKFGGSYYDQKKTSSKCVGGVMDCADVTFINEKLSPMIRTKSGSNSPRVTSIENFNNASTLANESTCDNNEDLLTSRNKTAGKVEATIATSTQEVYKNMFNLDNKIDQLEPINRGKSRTVNEEKDFSSDSLVQHVHNLENPSNFKQSKMSIDFIENKLEREYRKIFSTKTKERNTIDENTASNFKSTSTLRRRFEALRRGINRKEEPITDSSIVKISSRASVPSKKDVSIVSDPPSLEARSYSNTKIYSPLESTPSPLKKKPINHDKTSPRKSFIRKKMGSPNWSTDIVDSDSQGVKGMFKLWGKKFNLEEDNYGKMTPADSENVTKQRKKPVDIVVPKEEAVMKEKKEGKRFSFFRRRNKDKSKQAYKSRKGITAGRCEVDGLMIKIGAANEYPPEPPIRKSHRNPEEFNGILRKTWLQRYLSSEVDSKHSAQIRWNNNMYTTSSSTVCELIDCIYKNTGIIFRSKSEMTTAESSNYQSYTTDPQITFMQQKIQAFMVPQILRDNKIASANSKKEIKNIKVTYSNQKWLIDKAKAFAHKIEVVLHSNNFVKRDKGLSSEYIVIDIPEGYFSDTSSNEDASQTSDEQVYNVVEYETANSNSYIKKRKKDKKMGTGDHAANEIQVTVSVKDSKNNESNILETVIKRPPLHRDVVLQGSNVYVPKRCDVIGVGIITQRDMRDIKKPILKMQDELTDESEHILPPQKKCEFAESYLQDYYRNCTPLGIELFPWCASDSHLRGSSDSSNSLNQGDGCKSCPNIYDDYKATTIVSSCNTSSCSRCLNLDKEKKPEEPKNPRTLFKSKNKKSVTPAGIFDTKRVLPKDSLEVFKRRKLYALSSKAIWAKMECGPPYCVPSNEDKCEQKSSNERPASYAGECKSDKKSKKRRKGHVSMQNCDVENDIDGILTFKGASGCAHCKKSETNLKHTKVIPEPTSEMAADAPCKESCTKKRKPACSQKNSVPCNKPVPSDCPMRSPSPCQAPCPPTAPPSAKIAPCGAPPLCPNSPNAIAKVSPTIPPCTRSSPIVSPQKSCTCTPKKQKSPCNSQEHANKWTPSPSTSPRKLPSGTPPSCKCSPPRTPPRKPPCSSPKGMSPPCQTPPYKTFEKSPSQEFPWPLKNQISDNPSRDSFARICKKTSSGCKVLIKKKSSATECTPDSTKPAKMQVQKCPPEKPKVCQGKPKLSGVHLKMLPIPKCPSKECIIWKNDNEGIIKLNSKEKITVRLRRPTASTEEIRDGCTMNVKDADGKTLFERIDYRKFDSRPHLVKEMYRDSRINRVATSDNDMTDEKISEENLSNSVPNVIEINLNLKFKQGDKGKRKEANDKDCDCSQKVLQEISDEQNDCPKDVYLIQDQQKPVNSKSERKDLDIKIIIKNYKSNSVKSKQSDNDCVSKVGEDFSNKITNKFQTVSTGYSDVLEQQAFSIHRTTIDLTDSKENKVQNDTSEELVSEFTESNPSKQVHTDSVVAKQSTTLNTGGSLITEQGEHENEISFVNTNSNFGVKRNSEKTIETNDERSETGLSTTENDDVFVSDAKLKSSESIPKVRNMEEKKAVLKQIFENTDNKKSNKSKMKNIRKMLRAVLTSDSSTHDDIDVNNELANEVTYASLKPDYFENSESMNNYYGSSTSMKDSHTDVEDAMYPSEDNSECSDDSRKNGACLCSHFAAKLNIKSRNGCCCRPDKKDEEIGCDLIDENNYRCKPDYVDAQTQDSKCLFKAMKAKQQFIINEIELKSGAYEDGSKQTEVTAPHSKAIEISQTKRLNSLSISDEDEIVIMKSNTEIISRRIRKLKAADILQSQETKKAVLEIYAEKSLSNERIVAKLPKFVYNKESEICRYHEFVSFDSQ